MASKSRMFICTYNNPPSGEAEQYLSKWHSQAKAVYVTGQLEKGSGGTVHLQYYLHFHSQQRISALKKHCGKSHFEPVKVNNGADDYCNKEDTRVEGPWTFGVKPARLNKAGDKKRRNAELLEKGAE